MSLTGERSCANVSEAKRINAAEKQKTSPGAGLFSFNMFVDHLGQFKHGDLIFVTEYGFQFCISINHSPVLFVLEIIFLDIVPDLLYYLCSWNRFASYHVS